MRRDSDEGWIGGVCAGLSSTTGVPATLLRVAFVVVPAGIPAYLALWLVMPDES